MSGGTRDKIAPVSNDTGRSEPEYLSPDDPSLSLVPKTALNKKTLKLVMGVVGGLISVAIVMSFSPKTNRRLRNSIDKDKQGYYLETPDSLAVNEEDYTNPFLKEEDEPSDIFEDGLLAGAGGAIGQDRYYSDDRRPPGQTVAAQPAQNSGATVFSSGPSYGPQKSQAQLDLEAASASPIFFGAPLPSDAHGAAQSHTGTGTTEQDAALSALANEIALSGQTQYEKQNQQQQKNDWLNSRKSDYSIYTDSFYTEPVAPGRELVAGTIIPIVLITGINSDLPGDISGQVIANVYDSYTGNSLLVPKGSRVYGSYDSQISFGQNRVLLAWDRITRPDGITITLGGMQGIDISGFAGVHDKVDNHYDSLLASVAIGSVFDLAIDVAGAAATSLTGLDALDSAIGEGSTTAKTAVDSFLSKAIERQPTLTVRSGWRCNMIVNKNIILPYYQEPIF